MDGRPLGFLGDVGCASFNAGKTVTTGEGGAVFARRTDVLDRARRAIHCGETWADGAPWYVDPRRAQSVVFPERGWNLQLSEVAAAVGRVQLRKLEGLAERRYENGARLRDSIRGVRLPTWGTARPAFWRLPLLVEDGVERDAVLDGLRRQGITAYRPSFSVLPAHPVFGDPAEVPNARAWDERAILLPTHPNLGWRELRDVAPALRRALGGYG